MNSKERVKRAIRFENPDRVPIRNMAMDAALHEHGEKLINLWKEIPGDFGDLTNSQIPHPDPKHIRPDGSYYRVERDVWGVEWEYVQYGITGHPKSRPLDDWRSLDSFKAPPLPAMSGPDFENAKKTVQEHQKKWYYIVGWSSIFEVMRAVRKFEDVLVDVMDDSPEINRLADIIADYQIGMVEYYIAVGADGIMLGDDWGSQNSLILSPNVWRRFFKPRYERIIEPMKKAGIDICFHTCGHILPLFDDLADLGLNVIWPQIGNNNNEILAQKCRERKICIELHMDRQKLMSFGTPVQIDAAVAKTRKTFGNEKGGIFYHAEIDNGFPFENVEALLRAFQKYA